MLTLSAKIRKDLGKKVKKLREKGIIPAVLYGPKIKPESLEIDLKEFEKIYKETGESSLVTLEIGSKKNIVLIHDVKRGPVSEKPIHVDFYQPSLEEEIEIKIPLIFEGESLAIKDLGGTLVKDISEIEIKVKPQNLPKEIRVNIGKLKTFEDYILIKDLEFPKDVKTLRKPEEIVASVSPPEKIEEELAKPVEEKIEEVEKVEKKKEEEIEGETTEKGEKTGKWPLNFPN